jgi:anti-sigma factor RsiW
MRCPDDALLDRWLDGALSIDETAALAGHVAACPACAARQNARLAEERDWRAALALDAAELAHLARADLAAAWRQAPALARPARWWPPLVVLCLAGAYAAWLVALPALEVLMALANRLGLVGVALAWLLGQAWYGGAAALDALATPPVVDPSLVVTSLAACLWLVMGRPWDFARARPNEPNA